ncbi:MAG: hypothetical protein FWC26_01740, partial [Fibromonadales bacterium]|nr:hypothetical protein [Fibromonadales bacterium]
MWFGFAFLSLMFLACGEHQFDSNANQHEYPVSSSGLAGISSSSLDDGQTNLSSSSKGEELNGSSSSDEDEDKDVCDISSRNHINAECFYEKTVTIGIGREMLFGSQAKLKFADNASLIIKESLKITGGAELYFGENSEILLDWDASLDVAGKAGSLVVLAAADSSKPWKGIRVYQYAKLANIEYANLHGAVIGIDFGKDGVLKNSKIHNNGYGIKQNSLFKAGNFEGNEFKSNTYDASVSLAVAATMGSPEQFEGKLHIPGSQNLGDVVLPSFDYFVDNGMITVNGELKINAGAHFYFTENSSIFVLNGSVEAIGTANNPIIFESADPESFWGRSSNNAALY